MANLAGTHMDQERWEEAVELQVHVMNVRKRVLGPDHFSTLIIMNNLAVTYEKSGRGKEAEELLEHVIERRRVVLGEGHPDTLESIASLAALYRNRDRSMKVVGNGNRASENAS
jgi:hypothetical protein